MLAAYTGVVERAASWVDRTVVGSTMRKDGQQSKEQRSCRTVLRRNEIRYPGNPPE